MEIEAGTLMSSLTTVGEKSDESWFKKLKSPIEKWLSLRSIIQDRFIGNLKKLPGMIVELGKDVRDLATNFL